MDKHFIEEVATAVKLVTKYDEGGKARVLALLPDEFSLEDLKEAMQRVRPDESMKP
jgi:hypothetical protein